MEEYLNVIHDVVWSFVKCNPGLDFDDASSEVYIACLEAEALYDPTKGKKSTFIHKVARSALLTLLTDSLYSRQKSNEMCADLMEFDNAFIDPLPSPEQMMIAQENWNELMDRLSPDAREICKLIMDESDIYLPTDKPKLCRGIISRELKDRQWGWTKIWNTFNEMKEVFAIPA